MNPSCYGCQHLSSDTDGNDWRWPVCAHPAMGGDSGGGIIVTSGDADSPDVPAWCPLSGGERPGDAHAGPTVVDVRLSHVSDEMRAELSAAIERHMAVATRARLVTMVLRDPETERTEPLLDEDGRVIGAAKWRVEADGPGPTWCEVTDGAAVRRLLDATKAGHARRVANGTAEPMRVYKLDDEGRVVEAGDLEVCDE